MSDLRDPSAPRIGLTGLATMGQNLARNIARSGFSIVVHNRTSAKVDELLEEYGDEGAISGQHDAPAFVAALSRPRAIIMMVKAGAPVDAVIAELLPLLEEGDLLIDGGNSLWTDTERRAEQLAEAGIRYLGTGVSGGEEGALLGPSIMPGGDRAAYDEVAEMLTTIAAQVDGEPCCTYIGPGGAGHYVKMVHNGIEYADMQLIAEAYDLLKHGLGMDNDELADTFGEWNRGDLDSFLIEITERILRRRDDDDGDIWLVDRVLDRAEQKGTGRWTAQSALELGSPITAITEAVFARGLSSAKEERVAASKVLPGPTPAPLEGDRQAWIDAVRDALYASKIVAYAQGWDQLRRAGDAFGYGLHLGELATIWRGGCIIRARFLDRIREAYETHPDTANLLLVPYFRERLEAAQDGWRRVLAAAVTNGIPAPAFTSCLAYYDGYRRERLPANLIQAQRDLFGAHTFERTDREGTFHADWAAGVHQPEGAEGRVPEPGVVKDRD